MATKQAEETPGEERLAASGPAEPEWLQVMTARGISPRLWRIYVHVWLVCLAFPVATLIETPPDLPRLASALAGLGIYAAFYVAFMQRHPMDTAVETGSRGLLVRLAVLVVTLLALSLSVLFGSTFLWLLVGVGIVAGRNLPMRDAHLVATVLPLMAVAMALALGGSLSAVDWLHILPLALLIRALGLNMLGLTLQFGAIHDVHVAQQEMARRAVVEERLRLARDLHDLLGHTLSLIVLKSELAGRLIEKAPAQAKIEIQELEGVARQALHEVRQAVAGYRQPTLDSELDGARQMLEAAGIACMVENSTGILPSELNATLAWAIREGVTNVIRHSRAHECRIQITRTDGMLTVEVVNDGYAGQDGGVMQPGSGLVGLSERVKAQGGTIQAGPPSKAASQFRLMVRLPLPGAGAKEQRL